jgi:hypothetical protein
VLANLLGTADNETLYDTIGLDHLYREEEKKRCSIYQVQLLRL